MEKQDKADSYLRNYFPKAVISIGAIWLLTVANSATNMMCFVVGLCLLLAMKQPIVKRNCRLLIPLTAVGGVILVMLDQLLGMAGNLVVSLGRDPTLTGRTEVWKELLNMGTNPVVGTGFGSFWLGERLLILWERYWWNPTEAHNGYLEIYLELGLVGLLFLVGVIISGIKNIHGKIKSDYLFGGLCFCLLIISLLQNITESSFRPGQFMYFIFVAIIIRVRPRDEVEFRS